MLQAQVKLVNDQPKPTRNLAKPDPIQEIDPG
jgi:hypothetical protein